MLKLRNSTNHPIVYLPWDNGEHGDEPSRGRQQSWAPNGTPEKNTQWTRSQVDNVLWPGRNNNSNNITTFLLSTTHNVDIFLDDTIFFLNFRLLLSVLEVAVHTTTTRTGAWEQGRKVWCWTLQQIPKSNIYQVSGAPCDSICSDQAEQGRGR